MSRIVFNLWTLIALVASLTGCGLVQTVSDATASTTQAIFYKQIKTLHLDVSARAATNIETSEMHGMSVSTLVRVYQLSDSKQMQRATYDSLLHSGEKVLGADLLDEQSVVVKPGEGAQMSVPLNEGAKFVAIVGLFREPDNSTPSWRLILTRDDLDPDRPRVIELSDNQLSLRPLVEG
ncbi:type VI secretion system lipoprotein TssJ [Pseudomonas huanghezhanensis]|uniref:type VI secretion system lipoprotein TssJ n=1 Tax=Pseudomonas huanghezhanensis TaxID=3002903 RepID=UPI0022860524|nr:type VI secretion system lipoprotein TssJ [Pseudomonas sp. BSw22131]